MKVWIRGRLAPRTPSQQRSMSLALALARPQMIGGSPERRETSSIPAVAEMRLTASRSSGDAAGKPAFLMAFIPRRESDRADFYLLIRGERSPGECSPSRSVVSKIRTTSSVWG